MVVQQTHEGFLREKMGSVRQQTMDIKLVATGETKVNGGVAESTAPKYARLKLVIQIRVGTPSDRQQDGINSPSRGLGFRQRKDTIDFFQEWEASPVLFLIVNILSGTI